MDRYVVVSMSADVTGSGLDQTLIIDTQPSPVVVVAVVKNALATTVVNALNGA